MQDSLKTRLWDAEEKTMHYNDFVITSTGHIAKVETHMEALGKFIIDQTDLEFDKKMIVMKCTGFRDEYQQLIFADDVVEVTIFDKEGNDFQFICKANVGDYGITFDEINKTENPQVFSVWSHNFTEDDLKIIGNIYENPELLEGGCDV